MTLTTPAPSQFRPPGPAWGPALGNGCGTTLAAYLVRLPLACVLIDIVGSSVTVVPRNLLGRLKMLLGKGRARLRDHSLVQMAREEGVGRSRLLPKVRVVGACSLCVAPIARACGSQARVAIIIWHVHVTVEEVKEGVLWHLDLDILLSISRVLDLHLVCDISTLLPLHSRALDCDHSTSLVHPHRDSQARGLQVVVGRKGKLHTEATGIHVAPGAREHALEGRTPLRHHLPSPKVKGMHMQQVLEHVCILSSDCLAGEGVSEKDYGPKGWNPRRRGPELLRVDRGDVGRPVHKGCTAQDGRAHALAVVHLEGAHFGPHLLLELLNLFLGLDHRLHARGDRGVIRAAQEVVRLHVL
mmetsp:Transcript_16159/g.43511  ORF Transcript_16159/g.43511 Transcript_16159/m.43511 type:complete len:356 (+) Transcript_16159:120-1187(+)